MSVSETLNRAADPAQRAGDRPTGLVVRAATPKEEWEWDTLVSRFANHQLFHLQAWIKLIESFSGAKPLYTVFVRGSDIVACLPGFLVRLGPLRIFGSPLEGWQTDHMGPVFDPAQITTHELFAALIPFLEQRYGIHHMELLCKDIDPEAARALGIESTPIPAFRVKLFPGDAAKALKALPSNTRNHLRKAQKLKLTATFETELDFVDDLYAQMQMVFTRRGYSIPFGKKRVAEGFRRLVPEGKALAISVALPDERKRIATGIFLIHGDELILWHWAHLKEHGASCPIELLTWTAMQRAMQAGCTSFEVGGNGWKKFGGERQDLIYRCIRSRYQWLRQLRTLARDVYRWQQSLRGRLAKQIQAKRQIQEDPNP